MATMRTTGHWRRGMVRLEARRGGGGLLVRRDEGAVTLEACVAVTIFMIFALLLVSVFPAFMAQHATAHALLQAAESLAIDCYAIENIDEVSFTRASAALTPMVDDWNDFTSWSEPNEAYTTLERWYPKRGVSDSDEAKVRETVKKRFLVYLVDVDPTNKNEPNLDRADEMLKQMHVKNGTSGLDFSGTVAVGNMRTLEIRLKYQFTNSFRLLPEPVTVEQSTIVRLWNNKARAITTTS